MTNLHLEYAVRIRTGFFRFRKEKKAALRGLNFNIKQGEIVGYLGGNGAGKSSTIKVMCGIIKPTQGQVLVNGREPYKNELERRAVVKRLGVVFGQRSQLLWDLPVGDSFRLLRSIYDIEPSLHTYNLKAFERFLELSPLLDTPVRQLSLGQRMRCEVAAAFLHDPILVLLDEPTIGLDAHVKDCLRRFLKWTNQEKGTTILLTSHDIGDIEALCKRILLLEKGQKAFDGTLEELSVGSGCGKVLLFNLGTPMSQAPVVRGRISSIELSEGGTKLTLYCDHGADVKDLITQVLEWADVRDVETKSPSIEDALKRFYAGGLLNASHIPSVTPC